MSTTPPQWKAARVASWRLWIEKQYDLRVRLGDVFLHWEILGV